MVTYYDVCRSAREVLREAGVEAATQEARLLTAFAAGKTITQLVRDYNLYTDKAEKTLELARRRAAGEPVAYILGAWEFFGLPFAVDKNVLIPRMDTEVLAETAIGMADGKKVLDLCCGSGCIGITIAKKCPSAHVICADISELALKTARRNAALNGVKAICVSADALLPPSDSIGRFDLIVCNPPYIASDEIPELDPSVRDYEPVIALDGGEDGLKFYKSVCSLWKETLNPDGKLLFEVGESQAEKVKTIAESAGFQFDKSVIDTGNVERVLLFSLK